MAEGDNKLLIGDITGICEIINSEVAKGVYKDALSPAVKQVGAVL